MSDWVIQFFKKLIVQFKTNEIIQNIFNLK